MATWRNQYVRINEYSRPGIKLKGVRKIIMHWTANPGASAANHFNYFDKSIVAAKRYASAHMFVDKTEALCIVPLDEVAYAANDGSYRGVPELTPNANFLSVSVELCLEKDGSFHPETLRRAEGVVKELCERYNLDPLNDVVRHYDVTRKNCPAPWVSNRQAFADFKLNVKAKMEAVKVADKPANKDDVKGHWAAKSIEKAQATGVMNGFSDGSFRPNDPLTRAQFAAVLDKLGLLDKE